MKINSQKQLKSFLQLCRSQGITEVEIGTMKFKLGDLPEPTKLKTEEPTAKDSISTPDEYTPEQVLMWSAATSEQQ